MKKIFSIIALFVIAAIAMPTEAATKWTNYKIRKFWTYRTKNGYTYRY